MKRRGIPLGTTPMGFCHQALVWCSCRGLWCDTTEEGTILNILLIEVCIVTVESSGAVWAVLQLRASREGKLWREGSVGMEMHRSLMRNAPDASTEDGKHSETESSCAYWHAPREVVAMHHVYWRAVTEIPNRGVWSITRRKEFPSCFLFVIL